MDTQDTRPYLTSAFDFSSEAILLLDPYEDIVIDANMAACKIFGFKHIDIAALPASRLFQHYIPELTVFTQAVIDQGEAWSNEIQALTYNMKSIAIEISAAAFPYYGHELLVFILQDLNRLKQRQEMPETNDIQRQQLPQWKKTMDTIFENIVRENQLILKT